MAVDPYIARGITPLGQGLPELALQMRGQQQRYELGKQDLANDTRRLGIYEQQVGLQGQQQQRQASDAQFEQEARIAYAMLKSGDPRFAISKMAEKSPQFAQFAQMDPQKAAAAAKQALEQHLGLAENMQKHENDLAKVGVEHKNRLEVEGVEAQNARALEGVKHSYQLGQIGARGDQSRLTDAAKPKPPMGPADRRNYQSLQKAIPRVQALDRRVGRMNAALDALEKGKYADTGPIDQFAAALSPEGQELNAAVQQVMSELQALTRIPGVGSQSDWEGRMQQLTLPRLGAHPEVNRKSAQEIQALKDDLMAAYQTAIGDYDEDSGESADGADPLGLRE
jgi:hypothetical protein